ncbi:MAG TPA: response regulator [Terracidiphilus sp.]|nr:response regulator [Terracidiphilus sp.]
MRALIVDDSRFARKMLRIMLEREGVECEEAEDGQTGLRRLHSGTHYDVALVDWNMPKMSGLDMVRKLRSEGLDEVKVMMVTTESQADFIERSLNAGANEYLMKPFDEEALREKLALIGIEER